MNMIPVFNSSNFDGYIGLSRRAGQTLLSFVTAHDELNRRLEKHNVALPDAVQGWHLLRKANLTREQKQLIALRAPQLEKKVIEALYLVLGQDFKAGGHDINMVLTVEASMAIEPTSTVAMWFRMRTLLSMTMRSPNGHLNMMMVPTMVGMTTSPTLMKSTGMGRRLLIPKLHTARLTLRTPMSMTFHGMMWRPMTLPMRPT